MAEAEQRVRVYVSGIVQGVFFRAHAIQRANKLGLRGYAKNLPDGRVLVVAEGKKQALDELLVFLKCSPGASRVEKCEVAWEKATGEFEGFGIRY